MTSTTWAHRLDGATGVDEILATARDFLARLDPADIGGLPGKCRPPAKIVDADDIGRYAYDLVRYECDDHERAELVDRLAHFFSHASAQVVRALERERAARADQAARAEEAMPSAPSFSPER
jgi:hypothetical protein